MGRRDHLNEHTEATCKFWMGRKAENVQLASMTMITFPCRSGDDITLSISPDHIMTSSENRFLVTISGRLSVWPETWRGSRADLCSLLTKVTASIKGQGRGSG